MRTKGSLQALLLLLQVLLAMLSTALFTDSFSATVRMVLQHCFRRVAAMQASCMVKWSICYMHPSCTGSFHRGFPSGTDKILFSSALPAIFPIIRFRLA